jgi:beta-lactamase regulating signal transducer with metallopeptidase domain
MTSYLTAAFRLVLDASWQSSFIILLILLVRPLIGSRIPARWRYLLWGLVLVRLLIPIAAFPSSPVSMQNIAVVDQPLARVDLIPPQSRGVQPSSGLFPQVSEAPAAAPNTFHALPIAVSWWSVAASIWLAGTLLALGIMICAQVLLRRRIHSKGAPIDSVVLAIWTQCRLRLRIKKGPAVHLSAEVDSPALVGLIRPVLLLPERSPAVFSPEDWEHIFLHELAHYRRADHGTHALQLVALSVHWFNPLVWLGFRQLRADRELAADEWALQHLEPERSTGYGDTLLKVLTESSGNKLSVAAVGIMEDRVQLKHRLATDRGLQPAQAYRFRGRIRAPCPDRSGYTHGIEPSKANRCTGGYDSWAAGSFDSVPCEG